MTGRQVTYVVLGGLLLAGHVLLITVGIARAAPVLGGAAAAALLAALAYLHVVGLRRLRDRRRGPDPASEQTR